MVNFTPAMPQMYRLEPPLQWSSKFLLYYVMLAGIMEKSQVTGLLVQQVKPGKEALERWFIDTVAQDIRKKKPDVLLFEQLWDVRYPYSNFDATKWFLSHKKLATILQRYHLRKEFELCEDPKRPQLVSRCSYRLYTREAE